MKYVIVKRSLKKDPDNSKRQYLAHTSVVCKSPSWNIYYGTLQDKNIMLFNKLEEGENYIKKHLNRPMDLTYFGGKEVNSHLCIRFKDVNIWTRRKAMSLESAKKSLANAVKNRMVEEESKKELTKEQINANIDRLLKNAEENERFRNGDYSKPLDLPTYTTVKKAPAIIEHRSRKHMTVSVTPKGGVPHNTNEIHANILIKDMNSGLYILVPQSGNCTLVKRDDCTLFSNSNQSHYIISNIQARSFMACYHNMKLVEVYMETDKPIRKQEIYDGRTALDKYLHSFDDKDSKDMFDDIVKKHKKTVIEKAKKFIKKNDEVLIKRGIIKSEKKSKPIKKPRR